MTAETLILDANDVARLLDPDACRDAIASAFRAHEAGGTMGPVSTGFALPGGSVHAKLAGLTDDGRTFVAVKANVNLPDNPAHGRPTIQGVLILFDADEGRPLAVMDSIVVTSIRTAAVAALAAMHLADPGAEIVTIVGCGEQGEAQLRAMTRVRPIRRAFAVDRDVERAQAFADRLSAALRIRITPTHDLAAALSSSQIAVTCTTSREPFVWRAHLHAGLFIAAVGADNPGKQEIDVDALAASRVVVDGLAACAAGGDLHHAIRERRMTERDVHGELSAIVAGRVAGRTAPDEVFIFDSTGTALQDVAAALLVYRRALNGGAGRRN